MMLTTLRKCTAFLSPQMRWQWMSLVPLAVLGAFLEAVGAVAVFALIKIIGDPTQVTTLPVVSTLYTWLPWQVEGQIVLSFTVLVGVFYIVKNGLLAVAGYVQSIVAGHSVASLSRRMFLGYLMVPYPFHFQRNSAELIRNITDAVDVVFRQVMLSAVSLVSEALIVTGIVVVLMVSAPFVTLFTVALLFGTVAVLLKLTRRVFTRWGARQQELRKTILQSLHQSLGGLKEVKVLGREQFFYNIFARRQGTLVRVHSRYATGTTAPRLLIETVFVCGMLLVIVLVTREGRDALDLVSLLGLYAYAGFRIIPSAYRIMLSVSVIRHGTAAVNHVYNDFMAFAPHLPEADRTTNGEDLSFTDGLVLDNVSYAYSAEDAPVLEEVSLTIRRGESIGIVGPTGVGKSTLIDLVLGLLHPSTGRILVDGKDIFSAMRSWRHKIGYVPQSIFLTDDTLRRNIAFGLEDAEIDERQLHIAVRMAQLEKFVATLPRGLETVVGERGVRLSGGQRQRVGIARALYHEPEILVFDEATSALDNQTERAVIGAIESLRGEKTLLIVAHRLSTVRGCDRLVFLRDGRIAGCGSFDELLVNNADFRDMAAVTNGKVISN